MGKYYVSFKKTSYLLIVTFFLLLQAVGLSQTISSPTITIAPSGTICAGSNITFTYVTTGIFTAGNVFTVQLSNPSGSFATSPVNLGTVAATQATATTSVTRTATYAVPFNSANGALYRVRAISSNPGVNGADNGYGFTISAPTTSLAIGFSAVCQNEIVSIVLSKTCNFPAGNTFAFQLSDASGSFASPTTLSTYTSTAAATYTVTIPSGTPAGSNYQIQVVSSNTSTPNSVTSSFSVNVPSGTPGVFGNGAWNAFCYNGANNFTTNYQGYYTENNLSFSTTTRFTTTVSPSSADGSSGNAYQGCPFSAAGTQYSVSYLRTNFTCGLYQLDIPYHDDYVYLLINGTNVFQHLGCCDAHTNVWTGFLGASTTVEIRYTNYGGPGGLTFSVTPINPLSMSSPITICSGTSGTVSATNSSTVAVNYSWTPSAFASPSSGTLTTAVSPTTTTVFTLSAVDAAATNNTGCAVTGTVNVNVNPVPTTTVSETLPPPVNTYTPTAICYGANTATLTAGGANTYTWSPAAGLNTTTGYSVIANPSVTTNYTVSGSNNCAVVNASTVVTVQVQPTAPSTVTPGNNIWNVFCYADNNWSNYYGYYTETSLSFTTSPTRWNQNNGPSTCTTTTGGSLAYSGCSFGGTIWTMWFRRTGIPCGYYQIDIPGHDDNTFLFINGVQVWSHVGCCDAHVNVWSGFIGPSTVVEFKQYNGAGPGYLTANFTPSTYPVLSPPATICASTTTTLTANYISGANYAWDDGAGGATLSPTTGTTTVATPTVSTNYTCTVTDPVTTCSASASVLITVNPSPATAVTPTTGTINCSINSFTLTASGANTYSWSPTAGLSASTGISVIASPTATTIYTVTGSNNCATVTATSTITVVALATPTVFPTNIWNAYCYGDQTFTNYYGYYTVPTNTTASTFDINTATQWTAASAIPSNTNGTAPTAYKGCVMPNNNWGISFKRTGFPCGTYSLNITVDDIFYLYVNGTLVAQRSAAGTTNGIWIGTLCAASQVEIKLVQGGGGASILANFVPVNTGTTTTQYTWMGGTSNDWATAANWCGGGGGGNNVPTSLNDVVIGASGVQYMPSINTAGAQCKSITISAATASATPTSATTAAVPASTLTINGTNTLDVYGNWYNRGLFTANSSTVNMSGSTASTMSCTSTQNFYGLNINNSGGITMSSGTTQVSNLMNFTNGVFVVTSTVSPAALQILNGANVSGANNSSYVDGFMTKYGNSAFTFPLGTTSGGFGKIYRPIAMSAPSLTTDNFTSKYFYANPYLAYQTVTWNLGIDHLSGCEYWILNRTGGTSNVNVTLSWDVSSCGVTDLPSLLVARWDAGHNAWENQGNGGTTGNTTSGTIITSAPVTSFSPFTLASSSATTNPLPIELLYFTATAVNNTTELSWATATETKNRYFTIEKSNDGNNFEEFKQVNSEAFNGNSTTLLNYKTYDVSPYSGINYYRLKQTDYNGDYTYAKIVQVTFDKHSFVSIFPNPASNIVYINVSADYDNANLKFTDALGREIVSQKISSSDANTINTSGLTAGMYYLIIDNGSETHKTKVTIQK